MSFLRNLPRSIQTLRESRALAFAGIANPRQFFGMLQQHGIHFRDSIGFHDHHDYTKADYQRLKARCQSLAIDTLITTEKDAVKLDPLALSPLKVVVVKIAFEVDDLEGFSPDESPLGSQTNSELADPWNQLGGRFDPISTCP